MTDKRILIMGLPGAGKTFMATALKKYLASFADPKVTVWVKVIVQGVCPEPVVLVLAELPVHVLYSVPDDTALPRLVLQLVRSVLRAAKMPIRSLVTGLTLDVIEVPVCVAMLVILLHNADQLVAVTVPATATVPSVVLCPYPLLPVPVPHTSSTLASAVVLANPL